MAKRRRKSTRTRTPGPQGTGSGSARTTGSGTTATETRTGTAGRTRSTRPQPAPAGGQRTRAEKKELARRERDAVRRKIARQERARRIIWIGGVALAVGIGVLFFTRANETKQGQASLPGELVTEAPWPANSAQAAARAEVLGLPPEGTTLHEHANVTIFVHGQSEPVPTGIGVTEDADPPAIQSIHTHDATGVVHVESETARTFTLGEFFGVWGVRFTPSCIGGYCNDGTNTLRVFVNGKKVKEDPTSVPLDDQSVIVVTYGTADELPDPIPSIFDFGSVPQ